MAFQANELTRRTTGRGPCAGGSYGAVGHKRRQDISNTAPGPASPPGTIDRHAPRRMSAAIGKAKPCRRNEPDREGGKGFRAQRLRHPGPLSLATIRPRRRPAPDRQRRIVEPRAVQRRDALRKRFDVARRKNCSPRSTSTMNPGASFATRMSPRRRTRLQGFLRQQTAAASARDLQRLVASAPWDNVAAPKQIARSSRRAHQFRREAACQWIGRRRKAIGNELRRAEHVSQGRD